MIVGEVLKMNFKVNLIFFMCSRVIGKLGRKNDGEGGRLVEYLIVLISFVLNIVIYFMLFYNKE